MKRGKTYSGGKAAAVITPAVVLTVLITALLFLVPALSFSQDLPEWVREFGLKSPYSNQRYITGFGLAERGSDDSKAMEAAKTAALDDLIRKIRVQVTSSVTTAAAESEAGATSSVSIMSRSISSLKLSNVNFEVAHDWKHYYALAYALRGSLRSMYEQKGAEALQKILQGIAEAEKAEKSGEIGRSMDGYVRVLPFFSEVLENRSVYNVLIQGSYGSGFFSTLGFEGIRSSEDFFRLEGEVRNKIADLQKGPASDLETALEKLAVMLETQNVQGGSFQVPPFLYQNSDFTSSFGNYASRKLESLGSRRLGGGRGKVVIRCSYWEKGRDIELLAVAKEVESGETLGSAFALFPAQTVPRQYDIKPQNAEEALKTQYAIADGAIVDGGLKVEVWTNRGRSEDVLVFSGGESLELYFKVNQPAFLQITYDLATGEKVLLEESFYIGMDLVNQVVRYPYEFEVVPPYGVEHMMVSAFSKEPPPPNVVIDYIDGERYEVFGSAKEVVAQTRGLRKKQNDSGSTEVKVGEAFLTLTTMPED